MGMQCDFKGRTSKTSTYDYGHHRVEEEREDQDEAGQKAYEKKLEKGV
jgi:hypothetical protein